MFSAPARFDVAAPGAALVDAPMPLHDPVADLALTGTGLAGADAAFAWPPEGIRAPDEVFTIAVTNVSASGVTLPSAGAAGLLALAARGAAWRLALRLDGTRYTPHVRLDLVA